MATGVKPRDDDLQLTRTDLENIQEAMREKKFRDLLADYCEEVSDPANQALYQKEMTQLEKERGYDVTFINPKGGYVIKTSVAGDRKAFINICSNDNVGKPSCQAKMVDGKKGMNWQVPYTLIPPREDYDSKKQKCVIYDVVFHSDTLRMADQNKEFRKLVNNTAFDALKRTYDIHLDNNNLRFPKSLYKGTSVHAVIRTEDPNYKPPTDEDNEEIPPEVLEKLYPQRNFDSQPKQEPHEQRQRPKKCKIIRDEFSHTSEKGYTVPKYVIKQQKNVEFQDYTYHKDCKQYSAIPSQIVVEICLPLLSSTKDCILDVQERKLSLVSEKPAKYKLSITLPYAVNDQAGSAKFDKSKHMLFVTLPVIRKYDSSESANSLKIDSGVESEENSEQSDEDKDNLIEELSSIPAEVAVVQQQECIKKPEEFIDPCLGYILPPYTYNALDDSVAFTFHVKNTEPDSVKVKQDGNKVFIKFTSIGSGFVPIHYAVIISFDDNVTFDEISGEAWDNNVILQLAITGNMPQKFQIGLNEESLISDFFDVSPQTTSQRKESEVPEEEPSPVIAVSNLGSETNIVVSSNDNDSLEEDSSSPTEKQIVWTEGTHNVSSAKSILRKSMGRSFSESSMGDVSSSMDYISSDCIPEESSLKKTVRFSDIIAKQVYRVNSSIEGQKKKNQRKKSKKRTQDRRKSESEAEDEQFIDASKSSKAKSSLKQRRDSGLADTSDADTDCKNSPDQGHGFNQDKSRETSANKTLLDIVDNNTSDKVQPAIWESENENEKQDSDNKKPSTINCDTIKHNTDLYDPEKLIHGQYLEVKFKNDLIFDLDM